MSKVSTMNEVLDYMESYYKEKYGAFDFHITQNQFECRIKPNTYAYLKFVLLDVDTYIYLARHSMMESYLERVKMLYSTTNVDQLKRLEDCKYDTIFVETCIENSFDELQIYLRRELESTVLPTSKNPIIWVVAKEKGKNQVFVYDADTYDLIPNARYREYKYQGQLDWEQNRRYIMKDMNSFLDYFEEYFKNNHKATNIYIDDKKMKLYMNGKFKGGLEFPLLDAEAYRRLYNNNKLDKYLECVICKYGQTTVHSFLRMYAYKVEKIEIERCIENSMDEIMAYLDDREGGTVVDLGNVSIIYGIGVGDKDLTIYNASTYKAGNDVFMDNIVYRGELEWESEKAWDIIKQKNWLNEQMVEVDVVIQCDVKKIFMI